MFSKHLKDLSAPRKDFHLSYLKHTCVFFTLAQVVRQSSKDQITIIGAAVTLSEALKAADVLAGMGINARVIDPFTIKPIDAQTIMSAASQTGGKIITVEDHYPEGTYGCGTSVTLITILFVFFSCCILTRQNFKYPISPIFLHLKEQHCAHSYLFIFFFFWRQTTGVVFTNFRNSEKVLFYHSIQNIALRNMF